MDGSNKEDHTLNSEYDFSIQITPEEANGGVHDFILGRVAQHVAKGRKEWLTDARTDKTFRFEDAELLSRRFATFLQNIGLSKGDVVIYTSLDCSTLYLMLLGVWRSGGIVRSVYADELIETHLEKIRESRAKIFICDHPVAFALQSRIEEIPWPVKMLVFGGNVPNCTRVEEILLEMANSFEYPKEVKVNREDVALILSTSGTTGLCKGAVLTHENVLRSLKMYELMPFTKNPESPVMLFGKPTHATGAGFSLFNLAYGQRVITSPYSEKALFEAFHKYRAEAVYCVTPLLAPLVHSPLASQYDLSSLKNIFLAGAIAKPQFIDALYKLPSVQNVVNFLGMSECYILTSTMKLNRERRIENWPNTPSGSVGKICPGSKFQVRDLETDKPLGANQKGEFCFKRPVEFSHYLNNQKATKEFKKDGWLRTGDYGFYTEDGFLNLMLCDRIKDTFKDINCGNHISPNDLETVIRLHPAVREACVVPAYLDGEDFPRPRGFVLLKTGVEESKELAEEIRSFANERMAEYKHLTGGLYILKEFPIGKSGKLQRSMLKPPN